MRRAASAPPALDALTATAPLDRGARPSHPLVLVVAHEGGVLRSLVPATGTLSVGRVPPCDLLVPDGSVSRAHARIHCDAPPWVEDLGSTNGTLLGGARLAPGARGPLAAGTVVQLGTATMFVQSAREQDLHPEAAPLAPSAADGPIVVDPTMRELYRLIDVLGPSPLPILILGETGVGKEVFAHAVHAASHRAKGPFLRLNCAALAESVLESELFGHERGAFTGATATKQGLLESADGGTVFLDEVGELPASTQAKLLRVLENGEVLRVGALKPRRIDVRVVSATNRDLPALVRGGAFRADLYFRLNGMSVTLPPLRKRPTEIVPLALHILRAESAKAGRGYVGLAPDAERVLVGHPWPGNVRELRNVVTRALFLAQGEPIRPQHLVLCDPGVIVADDGADAGARPTLVPSPARAPTASVYAPVDEDTERAAIVAALDRCGGNQSRAAKELGISRRKLLNRLDHFKLPRPHKRLEDS